MSVYRTIGPLVLSSIAAHARAWISTYDVGGRGTKQNGIQWRIAAFDLAITVNVFACMRIIIGSVDSTGRTSRITPLQRGEYKNIS